ncbi:MAG: 2-C-methyl-D-erythritol 4-phosphate cytidylyltransferase [Chlamydiales bacterium]|nr:2-C-methyl-D-erythritol 4-phosphate cytidylyltransferase [Chlamydiales bacterium]
MRSQTPKQFLPLGNKPIILHSLDLFCEAGVQEIVVVCKEEYHNLFTGYPVFFAEPGTRRQDSVENALARCHHDMICVHDGARPFITLDLLAELYNVACHVGAAALGMPITSTVKQTCDKGVVKRTLDRSTVWEIQTPQIISRAILQQGFAKANKENLTVTDDVSLAELVGHPVQLIEGSSRNLKITTPEDIIIARNFYEN